MNGCSLDFWEEVFDFHRLKVILTEDTDDSPIGPECDGIQEGSADPNLSCLGDFAWPKDPGGAGFLFCFVGRSDPGIIIPAL